MLLTVTNDGAVTANEVVVGGEPPPPLRYLPGSTTRRLGPSGQAGPNASTGAALALADVEGQSPLAQGLSLIHI